MGACRFGHAELLDDITDHWDASTHKAERADFIQNLQSVAKKRSVRVSFLGGDVHVCAVGRFYTHPKVEDHLTAAYEAQGLSKVEICNLTLMFCW